MKTNAREFWASAFKRAIAGRTDEELTALADAFTERGGKVFVLELINRGNRGGTLKTKMGILNTPIPDGGIKPLKRTARRKS